MGITLGHPGDLKGPCPVVGAGNRDGLMSGLDGQRPRSCVHEGWERIRSLFRKEGVCHTTTDSRLSERDSTTPH